VPCAERERSLWLTEMMGDEVLERLPQRPTDPFPEEVSRRGVARRADATRHHAGGYTMTIPSFHHGVQGLGASRAVLRGMSPPERTATAPDRVPCTSSPLIYATALAYLASGRSIVPIAPGCKAPSIVTPGLGDTC
jgi:hypothetical protein